MTRSTFALRKFYALACIVTLTALALPTVLFAQPYPYGNSEVVIRNPTINAVSFTFALDGLHFDQNLQYANTTSFAVSVPAFETVGLDAPSSVQPNPDVPTVNSKSGILGCGRFRVTGDAPNVPLNLIDAYWGADPNPRFCIEFVYLGPGNVTCTVWDVTNNLAPVTAPVIPGQVLKYWSLARNLLPSYSRQRTMWNNQYFTFLGGDVPLPASGVTDALLDVNARVTGAMTVPTASTLRIEADADNPLPFTTTLQFTGTGSIAVYGSCITNQSVMHPQLLTPGSTLFTSGSVPPTPGSWSGAIFRSSATVWLRNLRSELAKVGMTFIDCPSPVTISCRTINNTLCGVKFTNSSGDHDNFQSSSTHSNAMEISGINSHPWFHHQGAFGNTVPGSFAGNGIVIEQNAEPIIEDAVISQNLNHGIILLTGARARIHACNIGNNGLASTPPRWDGIHAFQNYYQTSVRYSYIHHNDCGIRLNNGIVLGYLWDQPVSVDPLNPDSLGMNCIKRNRYNLFSDFGLFEMAEPYADLFGNAHWQGCFNTVVDPSFMQGYFNNGSTAWLERNYWGGNPSLWASGNSFLSTINPIYQDMAGCPIEEGISGSTSSTSSANSSLGTAQLFRQWQQNARNPFAWRSSVLSLLTGLSFNEASYAFHLVSAGATAADGESFYKTVRAMKLSDDVRGLANMHLALHLQRQEKWDAARSVCDDVAANVTPSSGGLYTNAHALAAYMQKYEGNTPSGLARLDSVLQSFPDDRELQMAWYLLGGGALPKRAVRGDGVPTAFALNAAYPNPFNPSTTISFSLPEPTELVLSISNVYGERVATLAEGLYDAGTHSLRFEASTFASGTYIVTLSANGQSRIAKIVLMK